MVYINKYRFSTLLLWLNILCNIYLLRSQEIWSNSYGSTGWEIAYSVQYLDNDGYLITGLTTSFGMGMDDILVLKTNLSGDVQWCRTYGGMSHDRAYSLMPTQDENFLIIGSSSSYSNGNTDAWIVKVNSWGDTIWTINIGGQEGDEAYFGCETNDNSYLIAGATGFIGHSQSKVWIIKISTTGDTLWTKTYGRGAANSMYQTLDGGYMIGGYTYPTNINSDMLIIKINSDGDSLWSKEYGGSADDWGYSICPSLDGGFVILGASWLESGYFLQLVKFNVNGDTIWTKILSETDASLPSKVIAVPNSGYLVCGNSMMPGDKRGYLCLIDSLGNMVWFKTYGGLNHDYFLDVKLIQNNGFILSGGTHSYSFGLSDFWLIKTDNWGNTADSTKKIKLPITKIDYDNQTQNTFDLDQNYPNPFNPLTRITYSLPYSNTVSLIIFDLSGKKVHTLVNEYQTVGNYSVDFDASNLSGGIYFYQLKVGNNFVATKKMIVAR